MRRGLRFGVAMLAITAVAAAAVAWALLAYQALVREEVRVEVCWSRIENLYQREWSLARWLAEAARDLPEAERAAVRELTEACDRTSEIVLSPEILNDAERFQHLLRLQAEQTARVRETLAAAARAGANGRRDLLDLGARFEAVDDRLADESRRFDAAVTRYNRFLAGFPEAVFARLYGFRPKPSLGAASGAGASIMPPASGFSWRFTGAPRC